MREDPYPTRYVKTKTVILANQAAAHSLLGDANQASTTAKEIIEFDPEESAGYRMLGCLYFIQGQLDRAHEAWELALQANISDAEAEVVKKWLSEAGMENYPGG